MGDRTVVATAAPKTGTPMVTVVVSPTAATETRATATAIAAREVAATVVATGGATATAEVEVVEVAQLSAPERGAPTKGPEASPVVAGGAEQPAVESGGGEAVATSGGRPPSGGGPTDDDDIRAEGETADRLLQDASSARRGAHAWDRVADMEMSASSQSFGPRSEGGMPQPVARPNVEPGRLVRVGREASAPLLQALVEGDAAEAELKVAR